MTATRLRARLVDVRNSRKEFAYSCGINFCDLNPVFQGRLVDYVGGKKRFAVASECRHPTQGFQNVTFVRKDLVPPFGISSVIKFQFNLISTPLNACFGSSRCPIAELVWDSADSWVGTIELTGGDIGVEFTWTGSQFRIVFTGCLTGFANAVISCYWPFEAGGGATLGSVDAACCGGIPQPSTIFTFNVWSYTNWRYAGRLIDIRDGVKLFAVGECCPPEPSCPLEIDCCGCEVNPLQWAFRVAGVVNGTCGGCTGFNTDWTLTYSDTCRWTSGDAGICTPGDSWSLNCAPGDGVWRLGTSTVAGHSAIYELSVDSWSCFGPNVMNRVQDYTVSCTNFPSTITLTAV